MMSQDETENAGSDLSEPADPRDGASAESSDPEAPKEAASGKREGKASSAPPPPDPLEVAKAECSKLRDQLLRTAADFDNYRKRSRRDVEDAQKKGTEEMLKTLLPVFDNLDRAATHAGSAADPKAIGEGVKMVLKQFVDTLERSGIKRISGVGMMFDPLVHEAIQQVETAEAAPGTVIADIQAGYQLGDRLVRAALVVVAKAPSKTVVDAEAPKSEPPN